MYREAVGVGRDLAAAAKWFREAAAQGHAGARSALEAMPEQPGTTWRGMMSRLWGGDQTQPG
jgi:TPR repeat protein